MTKIPHLDPVDGFNFPPFRIEEELVYHDRPLCYLLGNELGHQFLVHYLDSSDTKEFWYLTSIARSSVAPLFSGQLPLRDALEMAPAPSRFVIAVSERDSESFHAERVYRCPPIEQLSFALPNGTFRFFPDEFSEWLQPEFEPILDYAKHTLSEILYVSLKGINIPSPAWLPLTERTEHLAKLAERLTPAVRHVIVLQGGMGKKKLRAALAQLASVPENEERVLLATGRYLGEGFDDARLDTLFLTLPVSWRGTVAQYAGRLHRLHDRKREVRVYDYADLNAPMLARMFDRRCKGYEAIGYSILLPASAVPGWPAEVPLPVEPEWKRDYAASVQRLIRDGVDAHLGNLFVHATRKLQPDARGEDRARSATEAFLYRRLETLPETAGEFLVNAVLPIAFDEQGQMEVDLLCAQTRLAVELDGPQHLSDSDAYRRDRRKDALLQENGYFVLRFLAEDVGKHLDHVLDAILRTMVRRNGGSRGRTVP
jgi:very-short-patch-repair endonuclease